MSFDWFTAYGIIVSSYNMDHKYVRTAGEVKYCNSLGIFLYPTHAHGIIVNWTMHVTQLNIVNTKHG